MKKILAVLLSVCLILVMSVSCFAASTTSAKDAIVKVIMATDSSITEEEANIYATVMLVLVDDGSLSDQKISKEELLNAVEVAYNNGDITLAQRKAVIAKVNNGDFDKLFEMTIPTNGLPSGGSTGDIGSITDVQALIDQVKSIVNDDTKTAEEKATAIAGLVTSSNSDSVISVIDSLHNSGVIDDDLYNKISDAINSSSESTTASGSSVTSGLSDFISGILSTLGIGGGSSSDTTTTTKKSSSNSSSFEGGSAKTGDYAVVSVAGVALAAGIALVLTKKKK